MSTRSSTPSADRQNGERRDDDLPSLADRIRGFEERQYSYQDPIESRSSRVTSRNVSPPPPLPITPPSAAPVTREEFDNLRGALAESMSLMTAMSDTINRMARDRGAQAAPEAPDVPTRSSLPFSSTRPSTTPPPDRERRAAQRASFARRVEDILRRPEDSRDIRPLDEEDESQHGNGNV